MYKIIIFSKLVFIWVVLDFWDFQFYMVIGIVSSEELVERVSYTYSMTIVEISLPKSDKIIKWMTKIDNGSHAK